MLFRSRVAADTTLQTNIAAEAAARVAADTTLQTNVAAEATARTAADVTLQANIDAEAATRVEGFWRLFGPGQFFVFLGALIAELGFVGGVIGGAKKNKADQKQKQMAAAERKRR